MAYSDIIKKMFYRIAEGDQNAFHQLYKLYFQRVFNFIKYYIRADENCEELVSDVFISVWINREKLKDVEYYDAFIFTIAKNKALNYLDKVSRIPEFVNSYPLEFSAEESNPEKIILTDELKNIIQKSIDELPEKCKHVFLLSREKGLRYQDIAQVLSISEKTVNAQMVTAIKKIHKALKNYLTIVF